MPASAWLLKVSGASTWALDREPAELRSIPSRLIECVSFLTVLRKIETCDFVLARHA